MVSLTGDKGEETPLPAMELGNVGRKRQFVLDLGPMLDFGLIFDVGICPLRKSFQIYMALAQYLRNAWDYSL